jgi:putative peptidoglycan lipid II flippase
MSVSAAELPSMSGAVDWTPTICFGDRLNNGLRQIAFFVVPSAMAFLALGDVIAAALLQTGRFTHDDAVFVWEFLPDRPWACWRPLWDGSFGRPITR